MTDLVWRFRPSPDDGGRSGGDQAAMSFSRDLESFVREVLQNSLDAAAPPAIRRGAPVEVLFRKLELKDAAKRSFLTAIGWDELAKHLRASQGVVPAYADAILRIEDDSPLSLLTVSDANTWGLDGPETDDQSGRYANFVRNKLLTDKRAAEGGSYGLGKAVLWASSGISTVLVHSVPLQRGGSPDPARFIGVCHLPSHKVNPNSFDGPGWYGEDRNGSWAASARAVDPDVLSAIAATRSPGATGTTLVVPDFLVPDGVDSNLNEILLDAACKWFWPSILDGRLRVEVETGRARQVADPRGVPGLGDLIALLNTQAPGDDPEAESNRTAHVSMKLPATREAMRHMEGWRSHGSRTVHRAVEVRVRPIDNVDPDEVKNDFINQIACLRGAGMVVQYLRVRPNSPCYALAMAGRTLGEGEEENLVEQFLRTAEPPSHDRWTKGAQHLQDRYERGYKTVLDNLPRELCDQVLRLLAGRRIAGERPPVPAVLLRRLSVGTGRSPGESSNGGRFRHAVDQFAPDADGGDEVWSFRGWVSSGKERPWQFRIAAQAMGDAGGDPIPVLELSVNGKPIEDPAAPVSLAARVTRAEYTGKVSVRDLGPLARRTAIQLIVQPQPQEGGRPAAQENGP